MALKYLQHKWQKISLVIFLVFTVLILILALFVNSYWSPILENKVKDIVTTSSDSLYTVNFSSAELHVLRGTIVINNIDLKPDTAIYNSRKNHHIAPNNLVELHIKKLVLSHIHPFSLYFRHNLNIGRVMLYNPELYISFQLNHVRDTVLKDRRTAWQKIKKSLNYIHIGDILMGDVKFKYTDNSGHKIAISEFKEMNLSAHDLLIDSATQTDKSRLLYCKDITAELNNYKGNTSSGLYSYSINSLKLSTSKSQLTALGINLKPASTDVFFSRTHRDRFTLRLDSAQLNNFDFLNYHKYRILTGTRLTISDGSFQVFANPNHSSKKENMVKSFPNAAIDRIGDDITLDTVLFRRMNVIYNEFNTKSKQAGSLSFNNTNGTALNITNNKTALQKNSKFNIKLTSYFMNRGKLSTEFNFNLTDKDNAFNYKGTLGPMKLQALNPAVMPLAMLKVNGGTLQQFSFDIIANNAVAKGRVEMLYSDVKVSLLKADTTNDKLKKKLIESLYANIFILKHNNPDKPDEHPRVAFVQYTRPPEKAFFSSVWQTLLSGIKPSVGLDKKTQQAIVTMQDQQAENKRDHQERKAERLKRKAERKLKKELKKSENQ
ncbi:hypothetical protein KXD93_12390 [Mucilaginibacter sp. BJC16-A38]|uniref:hypothetical protein n=1 Tax=Mucilaginibacter phenanthrenivorans TaxID=1234842 RepID=UPI0021583025|nr:hypothetical protein [Mucilaginibacter phenanthrenivorans]MCR8558446.1 hypothetical protein [Mucilaginibacter phenanthrenivorans]